MWRRIEKGGWWIAGVLLTLLVILGGFQYRWLGALSDAERARAATNLARGTEAVGRGIDRLLTEAALAFVGSGGHGDDETVAALARWRATAPAPSLIAAVWRLTPRPGSRLVSYRLDEASGAFVEAPLPPAFDKLGPRERILRRGGPRARRSQRGAHADADSGVGPRAVGGRDRSPGDGLAGRRRAADSFGGPWRTLAGMRLGVRDRPPSIFVPSFPSEPSSLLSRLRAASTLVLELNEAALLEEILPALVARHLRPLAEASPWVEVVRIDTGEVVFRTGPSASNRRPDAETAFFRLLPGAAVDQDPHRSIAAAQTVDALPSAGGRADRAATDGDPIGRGVSGLAPMRRRSPVFWDRLVAGERPRWRLQAAHPEGSLEAQVRAARRRNLAVASGVLGVLAASVILLVASTRRAQALARERLEMVAAVTHELRTPLAAVCSAGANLADGVVSEPVGVRRYGRVIEDEGRRLARLVEQTLVYAGTLAGDALTGGTLAGGTFVLRATQVEPWVKKAVERRSHDLAAAGMVVRFVFDASAPAVDIDDEAMTRVLDNLVSNAIRHAREGGELEIASAYGSGRAASWGWWRKQGRHGHVELTVADRGAGLSASDRRQIFEPFFRGQRARDSAKGSGLGLAVVRAVVEAHGGSVAVASREGGGTVFTLRLPVASLPATPAKDSPAKDSPASETSAPARHATETPAPEVP